MEEIFDRAELLLGSEAMERLRRTRVIIFGVGGVGSWCAEALIRTGVGSLTMVDSDIVASSNINRQAPATTSTVGQPKVEAMRRRLTDINPTAEITALQMRYCADTARQFRLEDYDFVVDAIDSVADKALLIVNATSAPGVTLVSSMGAARKTDPTRMQIKEFWQAKGCPLAAALRRRFKYTGQYPRRKFKVVFSDEIVQTRPAPPPGTPNGSLMHITATWGMALASLVISKASRS